MLIMEIKCLLIRRSIRTDDQIKGFSLLVAQKHRMQAPAGTLKGRHEAKLRLE